MKTEQYILGTSLVGGKGEGYVIKLKKGQIDKEKIIDILEKVVEETRSDNDIISQFVVSFLSDAVFKDRLKKLLDLGFDTETSLKLAVKPLIDRLKGENQVFAIRAKEIEDILSQLACFIHLNIEDNRDYVFVGETLSVALALKLRKHRVKGCILKYLSRDSHAAIILSNAGIPTVVGIDPEIFEEGEYIYIDGDNGIVSREPIEGKIKVVQHKGYRFKTRRGEEVEILLNVDFPEDIYWVRKFSTGVGLFRTEYLFFMEKDIDRLKVFSDVKPKVIIRAFDIGGDKFSGDRSPLRLLNEMLPKFDALLDVVKNSENLYIMIPMISFVEEAKEFYDYVVLKKGIDRLGFMIETPMSVRLIEKIQGYAKFFSIGTNDLWSLYTGRPRGTGSIKEQINEEFGKVLMEIKEKSKVPVSVCGALASDEDGLKFLLKLGFRSFSVAPSFFNKAVEIVEGFDG